MSWWAKDIWYAFIAYFAINEAWALYQQHKGIRRGAVPLTWVIRDLTPKWLRAMILGWLAWHFLSS